MKWLNYHHLYYFMKVAEIGSMIKASEELRVGQPTLSAQIKNLEDNLGILFERRNRRLVLTERGRMVLNYAKDIFDRGDELLKVVERGELAAKREIIIGAQEGVPKAIISITIERVHKIYPAKIRVVEGDSSFLLEEVLKGHIDLLLTDHEMSHGSSSMIYQQVASEKLGVWGTDKYSSLSKNFPKSINNEEFVLPVAGHPLRHKIEQFCFDKEVHIKTKVECPDTALIKELGAHGFGLVVLGESTVRAWVKAGRLFQVGRLPFEQVYWLGIAKKSLKDPFAEIILKEFKAKSLKK